MNLISLEKNPEIKVNQKLEKFLNPDCIEIPFENMINIQKNMYIKMKKYLIIQNQQFLD